MYGELGLLKCQGMSITGSFPHCELLLLLPTEFQPGLMETLFRGLLLSLADKPQRRHRWPWGSMLDYFSIKSKYEYNICMQYAGVNICDMWHICPFPLMLWLLSPCVLTLRKNRGRWVFSLVSIGACSWAAYGCVDRLFSREPCSHSITSEWAGTGSEIGL